MAISVRWHYDLVTGAGFDNDGQNTAVKANFGHLMVNDVPFTAEKILFKSPAEHQIGDETNDVEMLVYHTN